MLMNLIRKLLTAYTLKTGKLISLYRRVCPRDGETWTAIVSRHYGLHHVGEKCTIRMNVKITDPAYVQLGNNVWLTGCTLIGHDDSVKMLNQAYGINVERVGKIDIRDNVFIGHQAIIMPGVTIGPDAIVAAGTVVTTDVPPGSIVGGSNGKVIGQVSDYVKRLEDQMTQLPWRDYPFMLSSYIGPSNDELDRIRIAHFFEKKPESQD
jgi:acetyltransferase-like isoleucine patch superfamily enzyme